MSTTAMRLTRRGLCGLAMATALAGPAPAREPLRRGGAQTFHGGSQEGTGIRRRAPGAGAGQTFLGGQQDGTGIRRRAPGAAPPGGATRREGAGFTGTPIDGQGI